MSKAKPFLTIVRRLADQFAPIIGLAVLLCLWELGVWFWRLPIFLLPAPTDIGSSIVRNSGLLMSHMFVTLFETLLGFGLSVIVGIPLAIIIVYSRICERTLYPLLVASQAVPKVALAPILLVSLGYGLLPKVLVAFLIAFFPIVVTTVTGLASVDRETLKLMRSMGASKFDIFRKVRLPHSVPSMLSGFKVAIALAVVGAVVGEFVGSRTGLGYYMLAATGNFDTPLVFACVFVLTLMGVILFYAIGLLEIPLRRWNRTIRIANAEERAPTFGM